MNELPRFRFDNALWPLAALAISNEMTNIFGCRMRTSLMLNICKGQCDEFEGTAKGQYNLNSDEDN